MALLHRLISFQKSRLCFFGKNIMFVDEAVIFVKGGEGRNTFPTEDQMGETAVKEEMLSCVSARR